MDESHPPLRHRVPSTRIERDTFLIHQVPTTTRSPFYVNALVITGREPVIVDTGTSDEGAQWLEDVFAVVAPADVRWIVVSHDDAEHAGNLASLIAACPSAVVVGNRDLSDHRREAFAGLPSERRRSVDVGVRLDVGDRHLLFVRPPVWDAAGTLAVLDQRTGVYWGTDAFACLLPDHPVQTVEELDVAFWAHGMAVFGHHLLEPWLDLLDDLRFAAMCDRARALGMTNIASAHSPLISDSSIDQAFALLRDLPRTAAAVQPDQRLDLHGSHGSGPLAPASPSSSAPVVHS
jgi:flavorubredoxin